MRATHHDAAAATVFSIKAQSPERERRIAELMGADTDYDDDLLLEEGALGHEIDVPLDGDAYCAASWECEFKSEFNRESKHGLAPHKPEDLDELLFAELAAV